MGLSAFPFLGKEEREEAPRGRGVCVCQILRACVRTRAPFLFILIINSFPLTEGRNNYHQAPGHSTVPRQATQAVDEQNFLTRRQ